MKLIGAIIILFVGLLQTSCGVYSLSEGRIPPEIKTVTVYDFGNTSLNASNIIAQKMTNQLKDRFLTQTNLKLVNIGGDIEFKGVITAYEIRGNAPTANQTTALNRLTITVKVEFTNNTNEQGNYSENFSRFAEYESSRNLIEVEESLQNQIFAQLVEDIYNKALVNW
ncbi:MAG: LptE family protein [Chitinophagales bacterium]|nr:LptE family protein [Chitinophagales bacterium]